MYTAMVFQLIHWWAGPPAVYVLALFVSWRCTYQVPCRCCADRAHLQHLPAVLVQRLWPCAHHMPTNAWRIV